MIIHFINEQVLYWLSGLTCTDENFIIKSGAQRVASSEGIALVAPDTSPSKLTFRTNVQHAQVNITFLPHFFKKNLFFFFSCCSFCLMLYGA